MANRYRKTCDGILARIVGGKLAHADETEVDLQKGKGYVWVVANMEDVFYHVQAEPGGGLPAGLARGLQGRARHRLLQRLRSLDCPQQKCLVHLIRDFNADLKGNPYDEEFKALAAEFGKLLRSIVDTIDKHGLKKEHLQQHKPEVSRFFRDLEPRVYRSEVAAGLPGEVLQSRGQAVHVPGLRRGPLEQQSRRTRDQGVRILPAALRRHDEASRGYRTTWCC